MLRKFLWYAMTSSHVGMHRLDGNTAAMFSTLYDLKDVTAK